MYATPNVMNKTFILHPQDQDNPHNQPLHIFRKTFLEVIILEELPDERYSRMTCMIDLEGRRESS